MPSRKLIALLLCLLTGPALAGYMTLLGAGAGGVAPAAQGNFIQSAYSDNLSSLNAIATPTFSGLATQFDSTGTLTYRPNNLLTYSNTFSNAAWTKATMTVAAGFTDPFGGSNATRLTATGATSYVVQSTTGSSGFNALTSIWVRRVSGSGTINLWTIGGSTGSAIVPTSTWTQYTATGNAPTGVAYAGVIIQTSGDVIEVYSATASAVTYETTPRPGDQVITTAAAYYGPRFDYTYNGSSWVPAGLLVEGAATNKVTYGEDVGNAVWAWISGGNSFTSNATVGPAGTTTATSIVPIASSYLHRSERGIAGFTLGDTVTISVFAKPNGYNNIQLGVYDTMYHGANFNVSTGAIANTDAGVTAKITPAANGFYRCSVTYTTAGATTIYFEQYVRPNGTIDFFNTWVADGTSGIYVDKAQMEVGQLSSYIPTGASAVTRPTETVQLTGAALAALQGANGSAIIQTVSEGTTAPAAITNLIRGTNSILYRDTTNKAGTTNGTNILLSTSTPTWSSATRTGLAWSASGRSLNYTGGTIATDANTVTNSGTIYLGSNAGSAAENGWYQSMAFYNVRLSDVTLTSKLTVNSSYAANDNGIRYAFADNDNLPVHWRLAL